MNVRHMVCANGEMCEFWVEQDGKRITEPVWFTPKGRPEDSYQEALRRLTSGLTLWRPETAGE